MKDRYLEVTFRKGQPLAAYLYLPREPGVKSVRTQKATPGILVDFAASGVPIGLEITAPSIVTVQEINGVLESLGQPHIEATDLAPLHAA